MFLAIFLLQRLNGELMTIIVDVIRNGSPFPEKPNKNMKISE